MREFRRFVMIECALGYVASVVNKNLSYVDFIKATIKAWPSPMPWEHWKAVVADELNTNDAEVRGIYKSLPYIKAEYRIQATVFFLKMRLSSWAPFMPGDDELMLILQEQRGVAGFTPHSDPTREFFLNAGDHSVDSLLPIAGARTKDKPAAGSKAKK